VTPSDAAPPGLLARADLLDRRLTDRLLATPRPDGSSRTWVKLLRRFSEAGSYGVGWVVLFALVAIFGGGVLRGLASALLVVATLGLNTLIKRRFRRPRPPKRAIDHMPGSYSFPSAHTSMAMVGAAGMSVIVGYPAIWWMLAAALGISRVVLGMHYLGDVLAGAVLGVLLALLVAAPLVSSIG
jgi:undecaprenyl-diphosphatase